MIGFGRRWPRAARISAALALLSGLAAFALVQSYVARIQASRPALGPPVAVVVATADLSRGVTLDTDALQIRQVPREFAPPGAIGDPADARGRVLVSALAAGEAVTATRLAAPRAGPVAALVPPGLRAFVVATDVPPEAVRAGDRVDVLATFGGGRPHTETVATALEVLSVLGSGQTDALSGAPSDAPRLVLLVSPDEAERLAYAGAFGELSVAIAGSEEGAMAPAPSAVPVGG
jgi:Flp pilus assembly protein CpaB